MRETLNINKERQKKTIFIFVGLVQNSKGEILLTNRKETELPEADNKWELPGGKVNFGETPQEAVEREILEETGYKVKALHLLPQPFMTTWQYPLIIQHTIIMCFDCQLLNGKRRRSINDHHINALQWVGRDRIKELDLLPGVTHFLSQKTP